MQKLTWKKVREYPASYGSIYGVHPTEKYVADLNGNVFAIFGNRGKDGYWWTRIIDGAIEHWWRCYSSDKTAAVLDAILEASADNAAYLQSTHQYTNDTIGIFLEDAQIVTYRM